MREAREQEPHERSESSLGHCLLDSDAESLRLARSTRWRSMLLSSGIQAVLLTAAVVVPLFASQTLPLLINDPPILVPKEMPLVDVPHSGTPQAQPGQHRPVPAGFYQPITVPTDIPPVTGGDEAPAMSSETIGYPTIGHPEGIPNLDPSLFDARSRPALAPPPREQPRPPRPVEVSKGTQAAKLIYKVEPRYPPLALQIRLEGNVELRALIARDGTVQNLEVASGHPLFIENTLQAVRLWRYQPTLLNDQPMEVQTYITVIFRISRN